MLLRASERACVRGGVFAGKALRCLPGAGCERSHLLGDRRWLCLRASPGTDGLC